MKEAVPRAGPQLDCCARVFVNVAHSLSTSASVLPRAGWTQFHKCSWHQSGDEKAMGELVGCIVFTTPGNFPIPLYCHCVLLYCKEESAAKNHVCGFWTPNGGCKASCCAVVSLLRQRSEVWTGCASWAPSPYLRPTPPQVWKTVEGVHLVIRI